MGTIASDMTIAHLGDEATEADLEEFRGYVDALMTRDGISEEEATDAVFGEGDWLENASRLGLA